MTDRPVGGALLAVLAAILVAGCCASWPPTTRAATIGRSPADATTIAPAHADAEASTLAAAIEEATSSLAAAAATVARNSSDKQPAVVRMNQTCYMKHIAWRVGDLDILRKCATIAGSLVLTFLEEEGDRGVGSSIFHYRFPDLMYVSSAVR